MDTVAKRIVQTLATRLGVVQVANGYNTDAGLRVFRGRRSFDASTVTLPVLSVWNPESEPDEMYHAERLDMTASVVVEGFAVADVNAPNDTAQDLLGDIKQALFLHETTADQTVNGLAVQIRFRGEVTQVPEEGATVVSVLVRADVFYPELHGDPYTVL